MENVSVVVVDDGVLRSKPAVARGGGGGGYCCCCAWAWVEGTEACGWGDRCGYCCWLGGEEEEPEPEDPGGEG